MTKLFLSLDDAVTIAVREFDADAVLARQEFEQKCYITDNQYAIGYNDGLNDAIKAIKDKAESEDKKIIDIECNAEEMKANRIFIDALSDIANGIVISLNSPISDEIEEELSDAESDNCN